MKSEEESMNDYPEGRCCLLSDRREVCVVNTWKYKPPGQTHPLFVSPANMPSEQTHSLFVSPANMPRNKLKDLVSDRRARSVKGNSHPNFSPEAPVRFWKMVNDTRQKLPPLERTTQSAPAPFESGCTVLPGLEAWCKARGVFIRETEQ